MLLGPVGPLCPYQSSYMQSDEIEKGMESFMEGGNDFYGPYMRFMLSIQAQQLPPKEEVAKLAEQMEKFNDNWKVLMTRFQLAPDFQAQQLWKFMGEFLEGQGISFSQQLKANEWQLEALRAFVAGTPPPELPPELEPIMKNPQANGPIPSAFMDDGFSPGITAAPFESEALKSEMVREELAKLIKDHKMIVKLGEQYGKWDREGKKMYIDQLEAVEDRWDIFIKRFELMGEQNPLFTEQAEAYLAKLQITPDEFREMNKKVRQQMREDAEKF